MPGFDDLVDCARVASSDKFSCEKYLRQKAKEANCRLMGPDFKVNQDALVFVLKKDGINGHAAVSLSGLEMLQNATDESIKDLINTRFANALKTLEVGG
jgi:hypothetical protein